MRLKFLGANRQVTGSRYLLHAAGLTLLVDCGLFQERPFLERNWETSPVDPASIDYLLLTHAHLDHTGLIPRLVKQGFRGSILATEPSVALAKIVMADSAHIQEEDAAYKARRHEKEGRSGPRPVEPLYTAQDAQRAGEQLDAVRYNEPVSLNDHVTVTWLEAGHILGSASLLVRVREAGQERTILFSGDVGQHGKPIIRDPADLDGADYVIMESTYGDRLHEEHGDVATQLADIVNDAVKRGGNVVIPTFAIERAQELMYYFGELARAGRVSRVPVYLDSPMAVDVTEVFRKHLDYMDDDYRALFDAGTPPLHYPGLKLVRSTEESKALNQVRGSNVIMASSGMCTGGRIKHHLKHNIGRTDSTILFVGFQSRDTLGRIILDGATQVRIHGRTWPVRAKVAQIFGFSAHGDRDDLMEWCGRFKPRCLYLTHGEEQAAESLAARIREHRGWRVEVPAYGQEVALD